MLISSIVKILSPELMDINKRHKKALARLEKANHKFGKAKGQIKKRAYKRAVYKKWVGCEEIGIKSWVPLWMIWILVKLNIVGARHVRVEEIGPQELER